MTTQTTAYTKLLNFTFNEPESEVFVFSGVAGSGKTTLIRMYTDIIQQVGLSYVTITFTGKAASVLRAKGVPAKTIHSLLYIPVMDEFGQIKEFILDPSPPSHDVVIIDEGSMVSSSILTDVLNYCTEHDSKLVVVGDVNQLPPVDDDGFNIMDMYDVRLEEVFRTEKDNPIIKLSQDILRNKSFPDDIYCGDKITVLDENLREFVGTHGKDFDIILCGTNRTRVQLNRIVRRSLGYTDMNLPECGDIIISLKNDHTHGIYNGERFKVIDIGEECKGNNRFDPSYPVSYRTYKIVSIDDTMNKAGMTFSLKIEDDIWNNGYSTGLSDYHPFDFGYALTVWKAQGSEFSNVCFFREDVSYFVDQHKFDYTAITRSSDTLTILEGKL